LTLNNDEPLSDFAFKFDLRRYSKAAREVLPSNQLGMFTGLVSGCAAAATVGPSRYPSPRRQTHIGPSFLQSADFGKSIPAPSADALPATLYGHST